jgi:hypothetical protein
VAGRRAQAFRDRMLAHMQTRTAADWMKDFVADGGIVAHPHPDDASSIRI